MNKRFIKEIRQLYLQQSQKQLLENDYIIYYDETDINVVKAIIKAPYDSVYRHKFIRLNIKIPDNYPHSPPEVTFINYDGVRIHPNMYQDGKCCATILNTWGDDRLEKWTSSMGVETILLTFHSFLDNNPYTYEPGGGDDSSYTVYVQYQSWISCLIRYLQNESIEIFNNFMHSYLLNNIDGIFNDLSNLQTIYTGGYYYCRCFEIDRYTIDYFRIMTSLQHYYNYIDFSENYTNDQISFEEFSNREYDCCICFDTKDQQENFQLESCKHSFHKNCVCEHVITNGNVCPMCRTDISNNDQIKIKELPEQQIQTINNDDSIWMINPLTKRRIKRGGKTWLYLKSIDAI